MTEFKKMILFVVVFIATWFTVGIFVWFIFLYDMSYLQAIRYPGYAFFMMFVGWLPATALMFDLKE